MAKLNISTEVEQLVEEILHENPDHEILLKYPPRITCRLRSGSWTSRGKEILAKAIIAPSREQLHAHIDAYIFVNGDQWPFFTDSQKLALVDHELYHIRPVLDGEEQKRDDNDNLKWTCVGHDLEEFAGVIRRHGLWREDIQDFASQVKQMELFPGSWTPAEDEAGDEAGDEVEGVGDKAEKIEARGAGSRDVEALGRGTPGKRRLELVGAGARD